MRSLTLLSNEKVVLIVKRTTNKESRRKQLGAAFNWFDINQAVVVKQNLSFVSLLDLFSGDSVCSSEASS